MKQRYFFAVSVLIALSGMASAADMSDPVGSTLLLPAPELNWTGCTLGGQVGDLRSRSSDWIVRTPGGAFPGQSLGRHEAAGWIGGVQVACNRQLAGGPVFGIQGDYIGANAEGSHDSALETGVAYQSRVKSLTTLTGRLGFAQDSALAYVKGGVAWERGDDRATTTVLGTAYSANVTRPGWTIGIGAEYALTRNLSGFVEYGYYHFGTRQIALTPRVPGLPVGLVDITQTTNLVRVGINYRFGFDH